MKTVIKNLKKGTLLVVMCTALLSNASEISSLKDVNLKKTALTIKDVKEGNLLSIKDNNGITLYKEIIEESGLYKKGFDLTELPNGYYFFELNKGLQIKTIPFIVRNNEVLFNKEKETTFFKPTTRVKNNRIFVSKLSLKENPVKIELYYLGNGDAELIHEELIENTKTVERIYKLDEKKKGTYKIVYKSEGRVISNYINL